MTNSISTDVTYGGAQCNEMVAKKEGCHSTAPVDKQINKYINGAFNFPSIIQYNVLATRNIKKNIYRVQATMTEKKESNVVLSNIDNNSPFKLESQYIHSWQR